MRKMILLLALLASSGLAHADVYKCVENGKTKFQDAPCPGSTSQANKVAANTHWPPELKAGVIAMCRNSVIKKLGLINRSEVDVAPFLAPCTCVFDELEKHGSAEHFINHQNELDMRITALMKGTCSPLHN